MNVNKRIVLVILSLIGAILFASPQLLLMVVLAPLFFLGYFELFGIVSLVCCLAFAWNIARLVQYFYDKRKE